MKTRYIFILIFLPMFVFGQTEGKVKKFAAGLNYEVNSSFRQLKYTDFNTEIGIIRNNEEVPKIGFTIGLNGRYQFSPKASANLGVLYSNVGMKTKMQPLNNTGQPNEPNLGYSEYDFNSVIFPLKINYTLKSYKKWDIYVHGGTALNLFTSKNTTFYTYIDDQLHSQNTNTQKDGYRKITYSGLVGIGLNCYIPEKTILVIEPIYRRYLTSIGLQPSGKEYLYSIGVNLKVMGAF